jgi:arginyl-tRNA synthetase
MTAVSKTAASKTAASMADRIDAVLIETFAALDLPVELARSTVSDRPDLADRQCNGAMAAAKKLRRNPREIGAAIIAALASRPEFAEVSLAGPGFVNMRLSPVFQAEMAQAQAEDPDLGLAKAATPERIVIDFGGPNVAKPLHVGHLRSLVIGESLRRMLSACGHQVASDVHLGDWGLQMGQLISELEIRQPNLPYFAAACTGPYPDVPPVTLADLEEMYPAAAKACEADPARLDAARAATAALQAGRPGYRALWQGFRDLSLAALQRDFDELGAHFDLLGGESDAAPLIAPLIAQLTAAGVAAESDGAIVVAVAEPDDRQPMPPLILAKADGAALYATTDLATLADRVARLRAQRILYVVDQRQALHFEQVFRAGRKSGLAASCRLDHVGFGTVNGKDGRALKTREGGTVKLADLLAEAVTMASRRIETSEHDSALQQAERTALARKIGIAAVKFADLSSNRISGYVFDPERLVSFEGKTGPYLQYACVRIGSILAKAQERGEASGALSLAHPAERALALECLRFPEVVAAAANALMPSEIADYAFGLAQRFSRFYADCPVLGEPDRAVQASRLKLCGLAHAVLSRALWMLGIEVPERM